MDFRWVVFFLVLGLAETVILACLVLSYLGLV